MNLSEDKKIKIFYEVIIALTEYDFDKVNSLLDLYSNPGHNAQSEQSSNFITTYYDTQTSSTALHFAIYHDAPVEIIEKLILLGSPINHLNNDGYAPIHFIALFNRYNMIDAFSNIAELSVDLVCPSYGENYCALHIAASLGHDKVVSKLVTTLNANIKALALDLSTALHIAVSNGNLETARQLLILGANKVAKDREGNTPYSCAIINNREDCVELLKTYQANHPMDLEQLLEPSGIYGDISAETISAHIEAPSLGMLCRKVIYDNQDNSELNEQLASLKASNNTLYRHLSLTL